MAMYDTRAMEKACRPGPVSGLQCSATTGTEKFRKHKLYGITLLPVLVSSSVGDPDPDLFAGSGSGNFSPDPAPLKVLVIIRKGDFFTTTFSVL
jgi:hypothetical protein